MPESILNPDGSGGQEAQSLLNADGTFVENYYQQLGDEFKDNATLASTKSLKDMASQLVSGQALLGKKVEALIPLDADAETQTAFLQKHMKAPSSVDQLVNIKKPDDWPKDIPFSDERLNGFKEMAVKNGMLPHQIKAGLEMYNQMVLDSYAAQTEQADQVNAEALKQLKETHKNNYPQVEANANAMLQKYGGQVGEVIAERYGNDPVLITFLNNIATANSEDNLESVADTKLTAIAEAQAEINKTMGDANHPYKNKKDPGHTAAVERMKKLYAIVHPEE